jgi:RNA recognition motif-containing protein
MSIYVGNLSYDVTEDDLQAVFADYGQVTRVYLPQDRESGRIRGFGFVEMSNETEEDKAIETLDGAKWMGRNMKVNKAKPREEGGGDRGDRRGGDRRGGNRPPRSGGGGNRY